MRRLDGLKGGRLVTDWNEIRNKYITTKTSYRKLAAEYGIDQATISRKGKDEKWVEARRQFVSETSAKIIESAKKAEVCRAGKFMAVADKLLGKIEAMVEAVIPERASPKDIRALTAAVKDLKEIQGVKSSLDQQEQEARIANLQKQVQKGTESKEITVELTGELEEYSG